ncbi:MAG: MBL fold metallo-hydrolase [Syntrophomonadaceae bacterium]|nr:MBL fold metallo-hydrolase [Syntrophomonadaceae bacterium]
MVINEFIRVVRPSWGSLVYLLRTEEGMVAVDTGAETGAASTVTAYVRHRFQEELRYIFLTHWHGDHTGAAEKIRELTGAEIICHRDESRLLAGTGEIEYCWNRPMPRTGLTPFLRMVSAAGYGLMKANTAPLQADILVKDGDMPFGPEWTVIHLPGHTPGSCGLWSERHRILFAGDTVLCVGRRTIHPPVSFLIQDRSKFYQSWCRLNRLGEINWILPGHFRPLRWNGPLDILPAVQKYA